MTAHDYNDDMIFAYHIATNSPDPSTQVGAVLLDSSEATIGVGWNDFTNGIDVRHWYGPKEDKLTRVVHAEVAAILAAAYAGLSTAGSTLVCPWSACSNCAKHIVAAGVRKLVRHPHEEDNHWRGEMMIGDEILACGGVSIEEIPPVPARVSLRRDGALWTPRV